MGPISPTAIHPPPVATLVTLAPTPPPLGVQLAWIVHLGSTRVGTITVAARAALLGHIVRGGLPVAPLAPVVK